MIAITQHVGSEAERTKNWIIGDQVPTITDHTVLFVASGNELNFLLKTMVATSQQTETVLEKIDPHTHKIPAIKALRQWTVDTLGICAGLKEAKLLIDSLALQSLTNKKETLLKAMQKFSGNSVSLAETMVSLAETISQQIKDKELTF